MMTRDPGDDFWAQTFDLAPELSLAHLNADIKGDLLDSRVCFLYGVLHLKELPLDLGQRRNIERADSAGFSRGAIPSSSPPGAPRPWRVCCGPFSKKIGLAGCKERNCRRLRAA